MIIDSTEFGSITVEGKCYNYDLVITADGLIKKRSSISEDFYGTHHVICTEEVKEILASKPQVLVIGTGQYGACRLEAGISRECAKLGTKLIAEPTPKAIISFNSTEARKAGLFHVTC